MCEPPGAAGSCEEPSAGTEECSTNKEYHAISATIPHVRFVCTCSVVVQLIRRLPVLFVAKNDLKCLSMTEQPTELRSIPQHPGRTTSSLQPFFLSACSYMFVCF